MAILAIRWAITQNGWFEPYTATCGLVFVGLELYRRYFGETDTSEGDEFRDVTNQMPELIAEMRQDLLGEGGQFVREFFMMSRNHVLGGSSKPRFTYYEEDHNNLRGKIDILENHGYITDVTPANVKVYRMSEEFIRLLIGGK